MYPNQNRPIMPIIKHKEKVPFIEYESVLAIVESDVGATPERFIEKVVEHMQVQGYHQVSALVQYALCRRQRAPFDLSKISEQWPSSCPSVVLAHKH